MRIFYAAGSRPNEALPGSGIWRRNLRGALAALGHEVVDFGFDLEPFYGHADPRAAEVAEFVASQQPLLEAALLSQIKRAHSQRRIDMFFSYFYSSFARPETIHAIADMGIVTVNWYCNASYQFNLVRDIAPAYTYSLVPERFRLEEYRQAGAHPIYCQEAANPEFYKPHNLAREYDVTFVGAAYGDRPAYVRFLLDAGLDAHAWGPGWRDLTRRLPASALPRRVTSQMKRRALGRPLHPRRLPSSVAGDSLTDDDMVRMFSRSKISLGFSSVGATALSAKPIRQVRLRDFEAPMSGAFYMLEYLEEIEDFFVPGKEIVCFEGQGDLVEKTRYYLAHETEREAIRLAGYERALRDHTWQKRLADAFAAMGLA